MYNRLTSVDKFSHKEASTKICDDHRHLSGFSKRNIRRYLPSNNPITPRRVRPSCPKNSSDEIIEPPVITTASRNESAEWCKRMGADYVINHHGDLKSQIKEVVGIDYADYILCLNNTDGHFDSMAQLVAPQGKICSIVETKAPVDLGGILRQKSATFVWELMFTRPLFQTRDMIAQHHLLNAVADLIDSKKIKTTLTDQLSPINAENLRKAHKKLESGTMIGKIALSGF